MLGQIFAFMAMLLSGFLFVFSIFIMFYCILCDAYDVNIEDSKFGNIIYIFLIKKKE